MKLAMIVAGVLAALPQISAAQDWSYDQTATQRCLATTKIQSNKRDCVGLSAEICADNAVGGFNTRSMTVCLGFELELFDKMLNQEYANVRGLSRELDQHDSGMNDDPVSMEDRLVQMQRAWITYRDATCAYEQRQMDGGTIGQLFYADCMATLTAEQTFRLQSSVLGL
jgi:uncharacterized protein YecT (DUF1311 family)